MKNKMLNLALESNATLFKRGFGTAVGIGLTAYGIHGLYKDIKSLFN